MIVRMEIDDEGPKFFIGGINAAMKNREKVLEVWSLICLEYAMNKIANGIGA